MQKPIKTRRWLYIYIFLGCLKIKQILLGNIKMTIIIRSAIPTVHLMTCGVFLTAVKRNNHQFKAHCWTVHAGSDKKVVLNLLVSLAERVVTILKIIDEITSKKVISCLF